MRKLYLDTCILIGFYDETDGHHKRVKEFFEHISERVKGGKIKLFCSAFSMVEFAKKMIEKSHIQKIQMLQHIQDMLNFNKIGEYPINIIQLQRKYRNSPKDIFEEFFVKDLQNVWLDVKNSPHYPPLIDVIHATIMKKCKIKNIVTLDTTDFENIKGINVIQLNKSDKIIL